MDFSFLPEKFYQALNLCDTDELYEIRFRKDFPVQLKGYGETFYMCNTGKTLLKSEAIYCKSEDIKEIINVVTEHSLYAFNEEIKQGFITTGNGIRIGLAGECVYDTQTLLTVKNVSSLNIRIPHEIKNCSEEIFNRVFTDKLRSVLIISPPSKGKTTILKDLIRKINGNYSASVLVIDERGEFSRITGENLDFIRRSDKLYAFGTGVRAMAPELIVTDELCGERDWECAKSAADSGVKILASIHGGDINDIRNKKNFIDGIFERYVVLKRDGLPGIIDKIYNEEFKVV